MPPKKVPAKPAAKAAATKPKTTTSTSKKAGPAKPTTTKKQDAKTEPKKDATPAAPPLPIVEMSIKGLISILFGDENARIRETGKWPLIIDTVGQVSTFLRHRDTNYLDILDHSKMSVDNIRMATLGSLKYGKPLVVDMLDVDIFEGCCKLFDNVQPGLMESILDKTIITEEKYVQLIKESDGPDYSEYNFNSMNMATFQLVFVTSHPAPPPNLMQRTYPIKVVP